MAPKFEPTRSFCVDQLRYSVSGVRRFVPATYGRVWRVRTEDKDTNNSHPYLTRETHASSVGVRHHRLRAAAVTVRRHGFRRHGEGIS
jgi:hypothetical protein